MGTLFFFVHLFLGIITNGQCKCLPITVEQNFKYSTAIFSGEVISVDTMKLFDKELPKLYYRGGHLATIKVIEIFKGKLKSDTISVMTGEGHGDCGYDFNIMKKYIIYSRESDYILIDSTNEKTLDFYTSPKIYLTTTICDRTTTETEKEQGLIKLYLLKKNN